MTTDRTTRSPLADLLVTGPFEEALRAAIHHSGLSLERIRYHLARHGRQVSVAALSHWQSGRSRPERRESLAALGVLEHVLAVPSGSLTALLGPPRPRGRSRTRKPTGLSIDLVWPPDPALPGLLTHFDIDSDEHLTRLSQHDLVRIDAQGAERSLRVRQVMRAERAGAGHTTVLYRLDEPSLRPPRLRGLRHCEVERVVYEHSIGCLVASLAFDRRLTRGESIMIEYEVALDPSANRSTYFERKLRFPVRDYVLEVEFDPAALPVRCHHEMRSTIGDRPHRRHVLRLDRSRCAHLAVCDARPGLYSMHWTWPTGQEPGSCPPSV